MALTHDTLDLVRVLCDVTLHMIEGELYQLTKNGDADITEDEHFDIIRRKTAFLFGGCAQIGGMLGAVSTEREQALREYGFNLGITFQLVDDLLDFTGDTQARRQADWQRPARRQGDAAADPPAPAGAGRRSRTIVRDIIASRTVTPEQWTELLRRLKEHASIDYAYRRAVEYAERAKKPLYAFPPSSERDALLALPDYVLSRDR